MLTTINKVKVKPPKIMIKDGDKPVKGEELFPESFANIYICAKKKSGKTSVIKTILEKCSTKNTTVIAFVSTLDKDVAWLAIREMLLKKGVPFVGYTSMKDDNGVDLLSAWVEAEIKKNSGIDDYEEEEEKEKEKKEFKIVSNPVMCFGDEGEHEEEEEEEEKVKKPRRSKYLAPEYIFVFDDLSDEIRSSKSLTALLKRNRHFYSKVIVSSQDKHDLPPSALRQMDYWLLFAGHPTEKLALIRKDGDLSIDFETFEKLYKDATEDKYCFLYVDVIKEEFRKCFNKKYNL